MITLLRRRNPSSIDACRTLVQFLEKATRGELAIFRTATDMAASDRIRLQSSSKDVSVPDIRFNAFNAIAGKGGILCGSQLISVAAFDMPVAEAIRGRGTRIPLSLVLQPAHRAKRIRVCSVLFLSAMWW
jgi:hypothetical protein